MASILKNLKKFFSNTDKTLWLLTISATVYSIMLISSMQRSYEYNYLTSQMIAIIVGYIMVIVMTLIDYERLLNLWWLFGGISLALLALVFVIGVNVAGTDDTAWINLPGGISFQPSEIVKVFFIITFTKHLQTLKENEKLHTLLGVLSLIVHMAVPVAIIHFQGDDGTVLVFLFVFLIMAFVGGVQLRYFLIMLLLIAAGIPILWNYVLNDEHKNRMSAVFDIDGNAMTTYGWQQYQGKVSVASGGMSGTGLGNGARVASGIVPEQENDFILTVAGEELGFIGCVLLIGLLLLILVKIIINAVTARDYAGRMLCIGVFSMIAVQTVVNVGMVLGLLPVIGITLPFFSSGGTSMLSMLMGIGLVHSVHYHKNRIDKPVGILRGKRYQYLNTQY